MQLRVNPFLSVLLLGPCCTQANQSTKKMPSYMELQRVGPILGLDLETNEIPYKCLLRICFCFFNFLVWFFLALSQFRNGENFGIRLAVGEIN